MQIKPRSTGCVSIRRSDTSTRCVSLCCSVRAEFRKRERKVCFDSVSEADTLRDCEAFSHPFFFLYIQKV